MNISSKLTLAAMLMAAAATAEGKSLVWNESTDGNMWTTHNVQTSSKPGSDVIVAVSDTVSGHPFGCLGTTFNELDWDAFNMLTRDEQDELLHRLFAPDGDLRFTRGRISMNCNDYGRSWWSCDEVPGDHELRYFNIDRDRRGQIPLIRAAQKFNPDLTFWTSPWSPPSWMKITQDYPVVSSRFNNADPRLDYLLFGDAESVDEDEMKFLGERDGVFPRKLATQDYMIQDPRYLQAYANYFCKFIDAYAAEGIPIDLVIYQNEAYSYTPYPGCPWTAEGTIRFNRDYLAPTLAEKHPEVKLYIGTFNTNRQDHVERVLADEGLRKAVTGVAFQWEGREIMPNIRRQYPEFRYICSESECGNGAMDWGAGEHTFFLLADNFGNGAEEWYNWNFILHKGGVSPWGWYQNALVEVDPETRAVRYTPEFYAVKHFSSVLTPGSRIVGYSGRERPETPALVVRDSKGDYAAAVANRSDQERKVTLTIGDKNLTVTLKPHSFNSFVSK